MLGTIIADNLVQTRTETRQGLHPDTILSLAVANWLLNGGEIEEYSLKMHLAAWKTRYPARQQPYSYTNDNPLLCAVPIGLWAPTLVQARKTAGMMATTIYPTRTMKDCLEKASAAVFLTKTIKDKQKLAGCFAEGLGLTLAASQHSACRSLRETEEALQLFLHVKSFRQAMEEITRGAIPLTTAGIALALTETHHGIPYFTKRRALNALPEDIRTVVEKIAQCSKLKTGVVSADQLLPAMTAH